MRNSNEKSWTVWLTSLLILTSLSLSASLASAQKQPNARLGSTAPTKSSSSAGSKAPAPENPEDLILVPKETVRSCEAQEALWDKMVEAGEEDARQLQACRQAARDAQLAASVIQRTQVVEIEDLKDQNAALTRQNAWLRNGLIVVTIVAVGYIGFDLLHARITTRF